METYLSKIRETVESLKRLQQETEEELEKLVIAIINRAFKGEKRSSGKPNHIKDLK